jgi:hypothetical protein
MKIVYSAADSVGNTVYGHCLVGDSIDEMEVEMFERLSTRIPLAQAATLKVTHTAFHSTLRHYERCGDEWNCVFEAEVRTGKLGAIIAVVLAVIAGALIVGTLI